VEFVSIKYGFRLEVFFVIFFYLGMVILLGALVERLYAAE
jgi:hypothetical protein